VITAGQQTRAMLASEPYLFAEDPTLFPRPYVKYATEPARAQDVPGALHRAYHQAIARPRGPVFVSVPEDDWDAETEPVRARTVHTELGANPEALGSVVIALEEARHPCLVVGPGVDRDGAWMETVKLAEQLGASVWAAPVSSRCSFPEDHPAFAGFLVPSRVKLAAQLHGHDVIAVLGAPVFTYHVHNEGPATPEHSTLFQLTDDPAAAARAAAGTAIIGSLKPALTYLLEHLPETPRAKPGRRAPATAPPSKDPIRPELVMATVRELMPEDAIVVEEAPTHRNAMHDHLPITAPSSFYVAASGGLGWGLPAAVGVALGSPGRRVVCLLGEGSSMYSIQALYTAAQHALPIAFVVLDNSAYVALKALGRTLGVTDPPGVDLPGLDLLSIAGGFGCPAQAVGRAADLTQALTTALRAPGPTLTAITVDAALQDLY
jgi:benzoylformate decarboxylase